MRDEKKDRRNKIFAYLLVVLFMSAWIILALIVKYCVPEREHDELYDEYLEEKYDVSVTKFVTDFVTNM